MAKKYLFFLPGFYGTELTDEKSSEVVFLSLTDLFGAQKSLTYPIPGLFDDALVLKAEAALKSVKLLPILLAVDGYGKTMRLLEKWCRDNGYELMALAYDWRADPVESLRRIKKQILSTGVTREDHPILVSHSNGSFLASYYLRYGDQDPETAVENYEGARLMSRAVLSGAPFRGVTSAFRNSLYGAPEFPVKQMLSAKAFASFPATYFLMATPEEARVRDRAGRQMGSLNLYNADAWEKNGWGLFNPQLDLPENTLEIRREWTRKWIGKAKAFHEKLNKPARNVPHLPVLVLNGEGYRTYEIGIETGKPENPFAFYPSDYFRLRMPIGYLSSAVDGDGVIPLTSARPFSWLMQMGAEVRNIHRKHHLLLKTREGRKIWRKFLTETEPSRGRLYTLPEASRIVSDDLPSQSPKTHKVGSLVDYP